MTKNRLKWPPFGDTGVRRTSLALVLLSVFLFQLILHLLSVKFFLYLYTEERYTHEIGTATAEKMEALESPVTVRFCMTEEDLKADAVYSLVYNTAEQYAEKYDTVRVSDKMLNIYTDAEEAAAYAEKAGAPIRTSSVIIESAQNTRVLEMQDFFVLDSENVITAYNGEEVFAGFLMWVQAPEENHKKVYFTVDHGETVSQTALQMRLLLAGYSPSPISLSKEEIPSDAAAIFILNPLYDFEKSAEDGLTYAELDRLGTWLDAGGNLFVTLDPAAESYGRLANLRAFLSAYGVSAGESVLLDPASKVSQNGKLLLSALLSDDGTEVGRVLTREPASLRFAATNKKNAEWQTYVQSFDTATEGENAGVYPIAAVASLPEGGHIFTAASGYLFFHDAIETDSYKNRVLLYRVLEAFGCETTPMGGTLLPIENEMLENLTMGEANAVLVITAAVLPTAVLVLAAVVLLRRRRA